MRRRPQRRGTAAARRRRHRAIAAALAAILLVAVSAAAADALTLAPGAVAGWGADGSGQLGDGAPASVRSLPVAAKVDSVVALVGGSSFAAAVRGDGSLWSWGSNADGQLGDPTAGSMRAAPAPVPQLSSAVAAAASHTGAPDFALALLADRTVRAWGSNVDGQLGDPALATGPGAASPSPVAVAGLSDATAVAAGGTHALALRADGTVAAWGSDVHGELGNSSVSSQSDVPVTVDGVGAAVAIAAGDGFSLALEHDGSVWAWGDNADGEQGTGSSGGTAAPHPIAGLADIRAIAAGGSHALALRSDGTVLAWGYNAYGQLGDGSQTTRPAPVPVSGLSGVELSGAGASRPVIAAGRDDSYAVRGDGTVMAWGDDSSGQLGDGASGSIRALAGPVRSLAGAASVAAGESSAFAVGPPPPALIEGVVRGADGRALAGVAVRVSGAVETVATTGADGSYAVSVPAGTYTLAPEGAPAGAPPGRYAPDACPGTAGPGSCTVAIGAGQMADVPFSYAPTTIVVDSAADAPEAGSSPASGVCDDGVGTCTLRAALEVANAAGGATIDFSIPGGAVPAIAISSPLPDVDQRTVIDGTTQASGQVELVDASDQLLESDPDTGAQRMRTGLALTGPASTVRGMTIDGFPVELRLAGAGGHTVERDLIGTDPSASAAPVPLWAGQARGATWAEPEEGIAGTRSLGSETLDPAGVRVTSAGNRIGGGNVISGNVNRGVVIKAPGNTVAGNTIGPARLSGNPRRAGLLHGAGPQLDQGEAVVALAGSTTIATNVIAGESDIRAPSGSGSGNSVAGNVFAFGAALVVEDDGTSVGGAAPGQGNIFAGESAGDVGVLLRGARDVVERNEVSGYRRAGVAVAASASSAQVGGDTAAAGNRIDANARGRRDALAGGVVIGSRGAGSDGNSVDHNEISGNGGGGGIVVAAGVGNRLLSNRMLANRSLAIDLGGVGVFRYDGLVPPLAGPNRLQPYPIVLDASAAGRVGARLVAAARSRYTIEAFSQHGCPVRSVTPGAGAHPIGSETVVTDAHGVADFVVGVARPLPGRDNALTTTATAPDGSTSEESPCLPAGSSAADFGRGGVEVIDRSVTLAAGRSVLVGVLCPPRTARLCAGRATLAGGEASRLLLAPGQVAELRLRLPRAALVALRRRRELRLAMLVVARDGRTPPDRRRKRAIVVVRLR